MSTYPSSRVKRGYTLLEMIVSVGVFSMVMLAATSSYLALIHLDRESRAMTDVMTNLSFVVESMTREIRTGHTYKCNDSDLTPNCATGTGGDSFSFIDARTPSREVRYFLQSGQVKAAIDVGADGIGVVTSPLTDSRVTINSLKFFVKGVGITGSDAIIQPQVRFVLSGTAVVKGSETITFQLQGSATRRDLETPPMALLPKAIALFGVTSRVAVRKRRTHL